LLEGFLRREEFTIELGNKVIYPELEQIKKDFVIGKWYNIYKKLSYQFDKSWGKLELDFRFKIRLNDLVKILKLIEEFKLYKKGILTIEPFNLENKSLKNVIANSENNIYENNQTNILRELAPKTEYKPKANRINT